MWDEWTFWALAFAVVDVALAVGVTIHAVLWKRDSRAVIAWVGLAWLAPILGPCLYFCLGINRIQRKAISLDLHNTADASRWPELTPEDDKQREAFAAEYPNLVGLTNVGRRLTGLSLVPANNVVPLNDGDEA